MSQIIEIVCEKCKNPFFQKQYNKICKQRFCSRSCSHSSRSHSLETKRKIGNTLKNSAKAKLTRALTVKPKIPKTCPLCNKEFEVFECSKNRIYCSKQCYKNDNNCKYRTVSSGGYREGSGRGKSGFYKGIYCQSTWELCWVIYNIDHKVIFKRFKGIIKGNGITYVPDFVLEDGTIVEIKGYEDKIKVKQKTDLAIKEGYKIIVLWGKDLKHIFHYIKEKYKTTKYETLYNK